MQQPRKRKKHLGYVVNKEVWVKVQVKIEYKPIFNLTAPAPQKRNKNRFSEWRKRSYKTAVVEKKHVGYVANKKVTPPAQPFS